MNMLKLIGAISAGVALAHVIDAVALVIAERLFDYNTPVKQLIDEINTSHHATHALTLEIRELRGRPVRL